MTVRDLIADLLDANPVQIRQHSPHVRHAENLANAGDSPDSPLSPANTQGHIRAYRWTVRVADGDPREVWLSHPGTAQQAMAGIEGALTADPYRWLTVGCATCRHLRRPGRSEGYCSIRADLDPAYGPAHPLRQLPADRGQTCAIWLLME